MHSCSTQVADAEPAAQRTQSAAQVCLRKPTQRRSNSFQSSHGALCRLSVAPTTNQASIAETGCDLLGWAWDRMQAARTREPGALLVGVCDMLLGSEARGNMPCCCCTAVTSSSMLPSSVMQLPAVCLWALPPPALCMLVPWRRTTCNRERRAPNQQRQHVSVAGVYATCCCWPYKLPSHWQWEPVHVCPLLNCPARKLTLQQPLPAQAHAADMGRNCWHWAANPPWQEALDHVPGRAAATRTTYRSMSDGQRAKTLTLHSHIHCDCVCNLLTVLSTACEHAGASRRADVCVPGSRMRAKPPMTLPMPPAARSSSWTLQGFRLLLPASACLPA